MTKRIPRTEREGTGYFFGQSLVFYNLSFRVVRFPVSDTTFETVLTNLDAVAFPPAKLKELYAMRWGIETSFRELKLTIGLQHFHAKKVEFVHQEIFARLTIVLISSGSSSSPNAFILMTLALLAAPVIFYDL